VRLYFHYCPSNFSNTYLLGTDFSPTDFTSAESPQQTEASPREAIIVDPGLMDASLLNMIEDNNYSLKGVLITHDHHHHVQGLRAVMRIYDTEVFAISPVVGEHHTNLVKDGQLFNIGTFKVEVFSIPGHSADSAVFKVDRFLFTGDAISACCLGNTASSYSAATQTSAIIRKILSLPGDYTILPGHGPPSSLEAERRFNLDLNSFEQHKNRRPAFRLEY
jgi:glyoxylase-like metal-dependent hydrolase (beta-lactamase superfamily II)